MADKCGECLSLDWNNKERWSSVEKYYCDELKKYVEPNDRACRYYSYNRNHNQKNKGGYTPSGWSFSTIIRDILGYDDNCELLNLLRSFRENVLKQNIQLLPILLEYDQISPLISERINLEEDKYKFSLEFAQNFLSPFAISFKAGDIDSAIATYQNMFGYLKARFGFDNIAVDYNVDHDLENLGKGRIRQPKASEI